MVAEGAAARIHAELSHPSPDREVPMRVRAKMRLETVTQRLGSGPQYDADGKHVGYAPRMLYDVKFMAVYSEKKDDENKQFWDATPSGHLELSTVKQLPWSIGHEYYIDMIPVEEA
jgi:hypothetical protein